MKQPSFPIYHPPTFKAVLHATAKSSQQRITESTEALFHGYAETLTAARLHDGALLASLLGRQYVAVLELAHATNVWLPDHRHKVRVTCDLPMFVCLLHTYTELMKDIYHRDNYLRVVGTLGFIAHLLSIDLPHAVDAAFLELYPNTQE